jgi:2-oxoglutarate ferredoxin oxidoreductase subunit delta
MAKVLFRSEVTFREDRCKGCGLCITVCPQDIISFADRLNAKGYHPVEISAHLIEDCTACAACARICPDCVITVERM